MNYTLTSPCAHCPFRKDIPAYLTKRRVQGFKEALVDDQQTFACHETTKHRGGDNPFNEGAVTADTQHCAGAMVLLERLEKPNQMMRIAERLGLYDRRKLNMEAPVFKNFRDMIKAQPS